MKKSLTIIIAIIAGAIASSLAAQVATSEPINKRSELIISENIFGANKIKLDSLSERDPRLYERVIVGSDTISIVIPEKNYGRYDRGLYNFLIIPRGQWSFGLTASYGEFSTEDIQVLSILKNIDIGVKAYSLKPSVSYFIGNNQSIGLKFDYTHASLDIANLAFEFDEDLAFTLSDVGYESNSYSASINYRNYIGLGPSKRFAIFNEVDLGFGNGSSRFTRLYNGELRDTRTNTLSASLNFSPGLCVFIMDYVSFNVSFGVFGLNLHHEKQITDGIDEGSRFSSGANFKFNIFNINFGVAVHI